MNSLASLPVTAAKKPARDEARSSLSVSKAPEAALRGTPLWSPPLEAPVARTLCTDCGISRSSDPKRCGRACQFIAPDYPRLEARVHGRPRDPTRPDELYFGPFLQMVRARLKAPLEGAQWTGITTRLGARLLETGAVEAVLAVGPHPEDRWRPEPVLVTEPEALAHCRGMRMGHAPLLALLEPARRRGIRRLALIGVPCQVYALRALEEELGFERIDVIGTPCSDNTSTENFHLFLERLSDRPETITYLEFRADYHVELRFEDGSKREIPFLNLPISDLPPDFFPTTCRTCVDYANVLSDLTVGYMGGDGQQWVVVRNERGQAIFDLLGDEVEVRPPTTSGRRKQHVAGFLVNLERAAGGLPVRRAPRWARPILAFLMPRIGPRGLEFARARLEMKALESIVHLRRTHPGRVKRMVPDHVWALAERYGLSRGPKERP